MKIVNIKKQKKNYIFMIVSLIVAMSAFASCGGQKSKLESVDFTPTIMDDWEVAMPEDVDMDPTLMAQFYLDAEKVETINSLLVIKNGKLIAEKYFHNGSIDFEQKLQSVTKSFTSALVGIAIEQGYIDGVDQKMMDFFPELEDEITDPRKYDITIEHLLQMRAGYPCDEESKELLELLYSGFRPSDLASVPLIRDPGSDFEYSNLSSHALAIILARATERDLKVYAYENLFTPLGITVDKWTRDWEGYRMGSAELYMTSREMAKLGVLYLNDGVYEDVQIVPKDWVSVSLKTHTENVLDNKVGKNFTDVGYGYQWWSATSGDIRYDLARGHGGQQIVMVDEFDLVIVVTANPQFGKHGGDAWKYERENLNFVGDFIRALQ